MEISQFSKLMVVPFMAYQLDKKMFQCTLLNLVVPSINSTDDPPPDFLISPCARGTRRSPFSTRRKLRRGWPTAKRRRQPLPRRRECSPCVKYQAQGEHIRRVLFVAHGEIKVTNGVGRSLRRRGQLRRVPRPWHTAN